VPAERATRRGAARVGRKTASIILNMVFGELEIAVTPHFRVAQSHRTRTRQDARAQSRPPCSHTPPQFRKDAHTGGCCTALRVHGALTGLPTCIIRDLCEYPHKTPARAPRPASRRLRRVLLAGRDLAASGVSAARVTSRLRRLRLRFRSTQGTTTASRGCYP